MGARLTYVKEEVSHAIAANKQVGHDVLRAKSFSFSLYRTKYVSASHSLTQPAKVAGTWPRTNACVQSCQFSTEKGVREREREKGRKKTKKGGRSYDFEGFLDIVDETPARNVHLI